MNEILSPRLVWPTGGQTLGRDDYLEGLEMGARAFSDQAIDLKDLIDDTEGRLAFARDVGCKYVVASSPAVPKPLDPAKPWPIAVAEAMNLEAWRSNAAAMETIGKRARKLGLRFGYHNHSAELLDYEGVMPLAEIVRMTNPKHVALELVQQKAVVSIR